MTEVRIRQLTPKSIGLTLPNETVQMHSLETGDVIDIEIKSVKKANTGMRPSDIADKSANVPSREHIADKSANVPLQEQRENNYNEISTERRSIKDILLKRR